MALKENEQENINLSPYADFDEDEEDNASEQQDAAQLAIAEQRELQEKSQKLLNMFTSKDNPWGYSQKGLAAKTLAMRALGTTHGMYARVPIVCKGERCPYAGSCVYQMNDMAPEGEFCPQETAMVEQEVTGYANDLDIENASFSDRTLLNEIVQCDIMLERCKALMAKEISPVIEMSIGIDQEGNEITQPAVSKAWESYERISKKRNEAMQLLMLTRKDRKGDGSTEQKSLSQILAEADDIIDA